MVHYLLIEKSIILSTTLPIKMTRSNLTTNHARHGQNDLSKLTGWFFLHLSFLGIFWLENPIEQTMNCSNAFYTTTLVNSIIMWCMFLIVCQPKYQETISCFQNLSMVLHVLASFKSYNMTTNWMNLCSFLIISPKTTTILATIFQPLLAHNHSILACWLLINMKYWPTMNLGHGNLALLPTYILLQIVKLRY
jgi:hypothetical protein